MASSDWYTRLIWGAINDLAKIGGVNLGSMGADGNQGVARQVTAEPTAARLPRATAKGTASLRSILNERNAELGQLEAPTHTDEDRNAICRRMNDLEGRLIDTPSASTDDVMAKLLLIAQIVEEGFEPDQEFAAKALAEAREMGLAEPTAAWVAAA